MTNIKPSTYQIKLAATCKKSLKKLSDSDKEAFKIVVEKLINDEVLDAKYNDHRLIGNLKDFRECHIKPDLLLIYQKRADELVLYCLDVGSHSKLFGR
ncbi:hypothetical protein BKN38_01120 [Helicobacter sp. CLO-3]|uniref:type II toxin-antitoxin system YafQ family toxin n=1 Tax=unclassified Helicobacter TaxID=2593540 RepID=UPI000805C441|nr:MULTISPECIES: type II toxin-antitoxin system YafQ family toxin [unclassified Helicobacter]OBV29509.1 hypothetical protein BA723_05250 [Helicobacter sp. CLO-3]OHU85646.1 hypothetical protein BKN38_01120 [Helicobacter sp. CLO-3]